MPCQAPHKCLLFILQIPNANLVVKVAAHIQEYLLGKARIAKVDNYFVQLVVDLLIAKHQIQRVFPGVIILQKVLILDLNVQSTLFRSPHHLLAATLTHATHVVVHISTSLTVLINTLLL